MTATGILTIRKIALTLGFVLSISTVATSSSFAYSAKARQMCTGDAFRLCSSEIPDIARIIVCMRRNKANLSPGCRAVMDQEDTEATKTKPAQTAPVAQKPSVATPVEQPAATATKPAQTAPVAQEPSVATPVEVKPVEVNSAFRGKRKKRHSQLIVERHIRREIRNFERAFGLLLPIPVLIEFYW